MKIVVWKVVAEVPDAVKPWRVANDLSIALAAHVVPEYSRAFPRVRIAHFVEKPGSKFEDVGQEVAP